MDEQTLLNAMRAEAETLSRHATNPTSDVSDWASKRRHSQARELTVLSPETRYEEERDTSLRLGSHRGDKRMASPPDRTAGNAGSADNGEFGNRRHVVEVRQACR